MFSIKHLIILSAMVCVAYCAVAVFPSSKSTTKEGFCEFNGAFIKQGESAKIGEDCVSYECSEGYTIRTSR